jgi:hypothetical protein|tara:strand:- start:15 stop:338 length:324 start_codon:yes stop_codon:yes gene_type:complete
MAKTKKKDSTSAMIKKLTGNRPEKINEQHLARLQASVKTIDQLTHEVGQIEVRKHALLKAMESIQTRMETLRVELKDEYGTDNISIQDGTINYETNDKENGEVNKKD